MPPLAHDADSPLIDTYLIHWRAPQWCVSAAASIWESDAVRVRCTVVDNGGSGGVALAQALDPRTDLVTTDENLGYTGAANRALERSLSEARRSEFVVIAAHDAHVEPGALAALSAAARTDEKIGIVGPILTAPALEAGGWWRGWRAIATKTWDASRAFEEREWVSGTLMLIRPECIEQIGGFDEALGSYVEDVDLCLRARDAGWKVGIAPEARVAGMGSASSNVTVSVDVNSLLLAVKRRGLRAVPPIVGRYAYWVLRGIAASLVPRRTRTRRRASLQHSIDHARAIGRIARGWRLVTRMARDPDAGVRRI